MEDIYVEQSKVPLIKTEINNNNKSYKVLRFENTFVKVHKWVIPQLIPLMLEGNL